jgi:hypothetical protein
MSAILEETILKSDLESQYSSLKSIAEEELALSEAAKAVNDFVDSSKIPVQIKKNRKQNRAEMFEFRRQLRRMRKTFEDIKRKKLELEDAKGKERFEEIDSRISAADISSKIVDSGDANQ